MGTQHALQAITVAVALLALAATYVYVRRKPEQWPYSAPPVSWLLHVVVFYAAVFARDAGVFHPALDFTLWSAIIRLQAALLILGVMAMLAYERLLFTGRPRHT